MTVQWQVTGRPYETDPRWAYMEWLFHEHRLLQLELMGNLDGEFSPCGTFVQTFHYPIDRDWRTVPPPSTRAVAVMRAAGVELPEGVQ